MKYFKVAELYTGDKELCEYFLSRNIPPEWKIDRPLIDAAESIREYFNSPFIITRGRNGTNANSAAGGKPDSFHLDGKALDGYLKGINPLEVLKYIKEHLPQIKGFGLGADFFHIDTRNADKLVEWKY